MTKEEFKEKMIPLWSFRNDGAGVELDLELMYHMQSVCVEFLSNQKMDGGKKLRAIFLMGALIGYCWEIGGEEFCKTFLDVFDESDESNSNSTK